MGVPKFFRYMSERYPCLSELLRENQVPEFDNLYLDMNGIIHNCSHPNDADVNFRISEEAIFEGIFHYVEYLFKMIRPQQLFFIAVDGVAPRAKMNQQRGRRFRSAAEAQELLDKAIAKGEAVPSGDRFDSNCITPGTAFMVRLQHALEHFIQVKIATDRLWKACTVILSGHETPGEGEHKIMEYIRHAKAQPDFNPNTRHCLYGLDADLIMLGLCTHERYFSLLREEVKFGKNDKKTSVLKEIRFYLLHLTLLSEYLELEFASLRGRLRFPFDIHKLIDDWVLLVYLVGNDFIPHLPHLHINENALPTLYAAYMDVLPQMDGYINEAGVLNLPRLQLLMRRLAVFDREMFLERYTDLKYLEGKCGKNNLEAFDVTADEINGSAAMDEDLMALIMSSDLLGSEAEEDGEPIVELGDIENDPELFEQEFEAHKKHYYVTKLGLAEYTEEVRAEQAECYIRALQWTLHYYYRGVVSWSWYYPHHYAPFISDVDNFAHLRLDYELANPFLPFQQLLSVLPAASRQHLPAAYHQLMMDPSSSVYDFYPPQFSTDLNGKQQAWEAVVLIPFIDEKRLLNAMRPCDAFLTDEEKRRNVHGPMLQYQYDAQQKSPLEAKYGFAYIAELPVRRTDIWRDSLHVTEDKLVLGPSKGAVLHGYAKGFPTFKHLPYHGELKELRVKIFNFPSKNDSMVVVLDPSASPADTAELAKKLIGAIVHVSWPHLMEAIVVRVADRSKTYERNSEPIQTDERSFNMWCRSITEHNNNRLAINVGSIKQLVHVRACSGTEYVLKDNGFVLNRLWNNVDMPYPAQTIVLDVKDVMKKQKPYLTMVEMFPPAGTVFLRATEFYGSMGHVADVSGSTGRIQARFLVYEEPDFAVVFETHQRSHKAYRNANDTAAMLGISVALLLQLTGTILVAPGGHRALNVDEKTLNIGLRLRMISKDEEAVGYCRKVHRTWLFSEKTVTLLRQYMDRVPGMMERLEMAHKTNVFFESDLFGEGNEGKLKELYDWLKTQDHVSAERRSCGIALLEQPAIEQLAELVDQYRTEHQPKVQTMFVGPHDLYRPGTKRAKLIDPSASFELLDRVIVAQETEDAPPGARGTIIGIHRVTDPNPVRREAIGQEDSYFEVLFDQPFDKGVSIYNIARTEKRVLRLVQGAVMNISHGKASAGHSYKVFPVGGKTRKEANAPAVSDGIKSISATKESIQRRINERIGTRTNVWRNSPPGVVDSTAPNTAEHDTATPGTESNRKVEFERLWKKLKESPKVASSSNSGGLFDDCDVQQFVQGSSPRHPTSGHPGHPWSSHRQIKRESVPKSDSWRQPAAPPQDVRKSEKQPVSADGENLAGILKQMLRISEPGGPSQEQPAVTNMAGPAPASLPKPPIQWQRQMSAPGPMTTVAFPDANAVRSSVGNVSQPVGGNVGMSANPFMTPYAMVAPNPMSMGFRPPIFRPPNHTYEVQPHQPPPFGAMLVQHPVYRMEPFAPMMTQMQVRPPMPFGGPTDGLMNPGQPRHMPPMQQHQQPQQPSWGPKGPHNLTSRNNPAGSGAFVPLQAMKKTAKGGGGAGGEAGGRTGNILSDVESISSVQQTMTTTGTTTTTTITASRTQNSFNEKHARRRQEVEQKQAETKQGFTSFLSQKPKDQHKSKQQKNKQNGAAIPARKVPVVSADSKIEDATIVKNVKSKPKTRIAARFGVAPDC
uniref:5'-3' exoribonuclease 1 n=1 Tax=Anopheles dirus TaxID=7168 RepID=A0A182NCW7_9DIPT